MKIGLLRASVAMFAVAIASPESAHAQTDTGSVVLGALLGNVLSGKTTLGPNAGEIEGWMVAAPLLESAARKIAVETKDASGILLVGNESANLGLVQSILAQHAWYMKKFKACGAAKGFLPSAAGIGEIIAAAPPPTTTINGYSLDIEDQALINAIQGQSPNKWRRLDDLVLAPSTNSFGGQWTSLQRERDIYAAGDCAKTDDGKATLASFDAIDARLNALGEKGEPSLLDQAGRLSAALQDSLQVLRVDIVRAGGSIVNTDTLWTRLGAPAIRLTGALVVGYRLINPVTGLSSTAGLIVCHAPKKSIGSLHRGDLPLVGVQNCGPSVTPR